MLVFYFDRKRLQWVHLAVVLACYGILGLGWGLYIAKAPDLFVAQFIGNVSGRLAGPMTLTRLVKGEVTRYVMAWALTDAHGVKLVRYLLPLSYLASILLCAFSKNLRRQTDVLLLMFVAVSLSLMLLEGTKKGWYLVHLTPLLASFLAISINRLWQRGNGHLAPRMLAAAQVLVVVFGVASLAYTASNRGFQRLYEPAAAYLNAHVGPQDLVMARSEFYFRLHCRTCLRDDANLGAFSGRRANYIVLDPDYQSNLVELEQTNPAAYRDIERRLNLEYHEVYRNLNYRVLWRTTASSRR